jgi:hypothetical protein
MAEWPGAYSKLGGMHHVSQHHSAAVLVLSPLPGAALAPALALMIKQMVQQSITSSVKDSLLDSLRGMGCKGVALAHALTSLDARGGASAAMAMPGMAGGAATQALVQTQMQAQMQAQMPPGMSLSPEQQAMMARMQGLMAQPLSPPQTLAAIDELAELGLLPRDIQKEMKECMVLLPQTAPALGMAMGMMAPVVPQIRQGREQMHKLSPAEQDEFAAAMAQELKELPSNERKAFLEHIDSGFFPAAVAAGVKKRLGAR